jgi:hypothetical protein
LISFAMMFSIVVFSFISNDANELWCTSIQWSCSISWIILL